MVRELIALTFTQSPKATKTLKTLLQKLFDEVCIHRKNIVDYVSNKYPKSYDFDKAISKTAKRIE